MTIEWRKQDPMATTKIPIDLFNSQIAEIVSAPETFREKDQKELSERQIHTRKLINNLETLYQVGRVINSIQTVEELLDHITESLLNVFGDVQRVCILLNENSKELEPKTIRTKADLPSQPFEIS